MNSILYFSNNFIITCPEFKNSKMTLKIGFTESEDENDDVDNVEAPNQNDKDL